MFEAMGAIGIAVTPEAFADTQFLNEEIVRVIGLPSSGLPSIGICPMRPSNTVAVTAMLAAGVTIEHRIQNLTPNKRMAVTSKPFLCIAYRADDVLKANEVFPVCGLDSTGKWLELNDNGDDTVLAHGEGDTDTGIEMVQVWMKGMTLSSWKRRLEGDSKRKTSATFGNGQQKMESFCAKRQHGSPR